MIDTFADGKTKKKQLDLLSDLTHRQDVTGEGINACDAGREGELFSEDFCSKT